MNANDVISIIIFLVIVGSSVIQSLFKKTDTGTKSSKSLSEIKKYLEEMAQGTNPDTTNAKPLYTQPYAGSGQRTDNLKQQSQPAQQQTTKRKNPKSQRGFDDLLESLPPVPNQEQKAVMMTSSTPVAKAKGAKKGGAAAAVGLQQSGYDRFKLPSHLNDVQKAIVLAEILKSPKAFEY